MTWGHALGSVGRVTGLAHFVIARRRLVIAAWIALTLFGVFSAVQVSNRWLESFSIPGYSAYEANQRAVKALGNGEITPVVVVAKSDGDITRVPGIQKFFADGRDRPAGLAISLLVHDARPRLPVAGPARRVRDHLPGRAGQLRGRQVRRVSSPS